MTVDDGPLLHRGSYICEKYELRVTERCLVEDLGLTAYSSFEVTLKHPIAQSFVQKRKNDPGSGKIVGPAAGNKTLYRLGRGHNHRGATWFDEHNGVVWLCAYGLHRSGEPDDAFQLFKALIETARIRPTLADYQHIGRDRGGRLVELGPTQAEAAIGLAVAKPGQIVVVDLAGQLPVQVTADVAGDVAEVSIAFPWKGLNHEQMLFIVRSFAASTDDIWENSDSLGSQPLASDEVGFTIWRAAT